MKSLIKELFFNVSFSLLMFVNYLANKLNDKWVSLGSRHDSLNSTLQDFFIEMTNTPSTFDKNLLRHYLRVRHMNDWINFKMKFCGQIMILLWWAAERIKLSWNTVLGYKATFVRYEPSCGRIMWGYDA